jgi:hypothetical protein
MMQRIALAVVLVILTAAPTGCIKGPEEADAYAGLYFLCIQEGRLDDALDLYSPEFFDDTNSRDGWLELLHTMNTKLGTLQSYELTTWNRRSVVGTEGSGTYWTLVYQTQYEKYPAEETIAVFKPSDSTTLSIIGHHIASEGFLPEN